MLDDDDTAMGFKSSTLAENIPADAINAIIHRLVSSLSEYQLEGKDKAYGTNNS